MRHNMLLLVAAVSPCLVSVGRAQTFAASTQTVDRAPVNYQREQERSRVGPMIGAGLGLGAIGFVAGGLITAAVAHDCASSDSCGLEWAFIGAATGGTLGMAWGVHLGNRRRGSFALDFLTAGAIWAAGITTVAVVENESVTYFMFVLIPVTQLAATVAVERGTARARARREAARVSIIPIRRGAAIAATVSF